ncbi:transcription factor DP [Actinidia rufa]|uniref:Transcription factor DP n=1 Tax=Actinidia rufa TaxID=165716 RepID=A0A7J0GJM0_9ERIC|nr:transcription factor DP [Actinidia rufa]
MHPIIVGATTAVMDNRCLGDVFGGFGHKHSGGESCIPGSTTYDSIPVAYKASQRSNQLSNHHDGAGWCLHWFVYCFIHFHVADEIIAEFTEAHNNTAVSLDKFAEKNIRRRVYDAINVLMALDIVIKEKKEIRWNGLPSANGKDMEEIKALRLKLMDRIGKKAAYLKEVEEQVPIAIDFRTPFSLHDDAYILRLLHCFQLPESKHSSQTSVLSSSSPDIASRGTKPFYWNSDTDMLK